MCERTTVSLGSPKTKFSTQGGLFSPEGQRAGNKRPKQETEDKGQEKKKEQGKGEGIFFLTLDREEMDVARRQIALYRSKWGTPVLGWVGLF